MTPTLLEKVSATAKAYLDDNSINGKQYRNCIDNLLVDADSQKTSVDDLVAAKTLSIDLLLMHFWQRLLGNNTLNTLIAVGGYGRGELHPHSDVDILILTPEKTSNSDNEKLSAFITLLWDFGLDLGHAVRSVKQCIEIAKEEISVITNLIESRRLAGDPKPFTELCEAVSPDKIWPPSLFFRQKLEEQTDRHQRYHDSTYRLEPNIKETPGGLRDLHMISWVAQRQYGNGRFSNLVFQSFLTKNELIQLEASRELLWKIRYKLHLLAKRKEDRLLFEYQRELAEQFGYEGKRNEPVEKFMQNYYRHVKVLVQLNDLLLQRFREVILVEQNHQATSLLNADFKICNQYLECREPDLFKHSPEKILKLFLDMAYRQDIKGVRANTIREIRENLHRLKPFTSASQTSQSYFTQLLQAPSGIARQLRRMSRYGVLAAYIPNFGHIVGRMQFDMFHIYTVDEHTLRVISYLRRFAQEKHEQEVPFANEIYQHIDKPELLFLAGLFHDIAKGRNGDHSLLGAIDARDFCLSHGYSADDTNLVEWLVAEHLTLSITAQKKDISDLDVIKNFSDKIGSPRRLRYLCLLTIADIRGTDPNLWSSWKESLIRQLYQTTEQFLNHDIDLRDQSAKAFETKQACLKALTDNNVEATNVTNLWSNIQEDYFFRNDKDTIQWQTKLIIDHHNNSNPNTALVATRTNLDAEITEVFIYTVDRPNLFSQITDVMDQLCLSIARADIHTATNGQSFDTFFVTEQNGSPIVSTDRQCEIKEQLKTTLNDNVTHNTKQRSTPRRLRVFENKPKIDFQKSRQNDHTAISIIALDAPGTLSKIAHAFRLCKLQLKAAYITTLGERIEDVFFVTNEDNHAITDKEHINTIHKTITELLTNDDD